MENAFKLTSATAPSWKERDDLFLEYKNLSRNFNVLYKLSSPIAHRCALYYLTPWRAGGLVCVPSQTLRAYSSTT